MSSFITADGRDHMLDVVSGRAQPLERWYLALCRSTPGITVAGSELDEVDAPEYLRGEILNVEGSWHLIHAQLSNVVPIGFPLAETEWGQVRTWAICDQPLDGRVFWVGDIPTTYVGEGDQVELPPYGLNLALGAL